MKNPWHNIPAFDYEAHMSAPHVGQTDFLNRTFRYIYNEIKPKSAAVIGCSTGNGFEHVDPELTELLVGIDINEEYLEIAKARFGKNNRVKFINADACFVSFEGKKFDLIHCALIFEYVDIALCLENLISHMNLNGTLSVILQCSGEDQKMISTTNYKSLEQLSSIMKLVDYKDFKKAANNFGLIESKKEIILLESGKSFYVGFYKNYKS